MQGSWPVSCEGRWRGKVTAEENTPLLHAPGGLCSGKRGSCQLLRLKPALGGNGGPGKWAHNCGQARGRGQHSWLRPAGATWARCDLWLPPQLLLVTLPTALSLDVQHRQDPFPAPQRTKPPGRRTRWGPAVRSSCGPSLRNLAQEHQPRSEHFCVHYCQALQSQWPYWELGHLCFLA